MSYLDENNIQIDMSNSSIIVRYDEIVYHDVSFIQLFPHSSPQQFIAVRYKKENNTQEIGIIKNLLNLPLKLQQKVTDAIDKRFFVPAITKIVSLISKRGTDTWQVETDRGNITFTVRDRGENVVTTEQGIIFITDTGKRRFRIVDIRKLDKKSMGFLEHIVM